MTWYLDTAAVMGALGLVSGWGVPSLIARIPEPTPDHEVDGVHEADTVTPGELGEGLVPPSAPDDLAREPKELYVSIAATRGLSWRTALASAAAAAMIGARVGWSGELLFLMYLVPVGVALAVVDWRTRLLPTRVIAPSYAVVVGLAVLAAVLGGDLDDLVRAGWGWAIAGGTFLLLWLIYPRGMGYGDVRLSGVLGIALGYLGWGELVVGVYAGFLIGGIGGTLLTLLRVVDRRAYPFGPFMLVGALVGILWGAPFAEFYLTSG